MSAGMQRWPDAMLSELVRTLDRPRRILPPADLLITRCPLVAKRNDPVAVAYRVRCARRTARERLAANIRRALAA